ncbi:hypothetical protein E4T56_gene10701 [Termitomyces sp. T112]|nr:hypothetical protein E4T56_gene10701 [Termitomyces sp. T112]
MEDKVASLEAQIQLLSDLHSRVQTLRHIPVVLLKAPMTPLSGQTLQPEFQQVRQVADTIRAEHVQEALRAARDSLGGDGSDLNPNLRREKRKRGRARSPESPEPYVEEKEGTRTLFADDDSHPVEFEAASVETDTGGRGGGDGAAVPVQGRADGVRAAGGGDGAGGGRECGGVWAAREEVATFGVGLCGVSEAGAGDRPDAGVAAGRGCAGGCDTAWCLLDALCRAMHDVPARALGRGSCAASRAGVGRRRMVRKTCRVRRLKFQMHADPRHPPNRNAHIGQPPALSSLML